MEKYTTTNQEILNIEYNMCRLLVKALNSSRTVLEASGKLGISERSVFRYMKDYQIEFEGNQYVMKKIPQYTIIVSA